LNFNTIEEVGLNILSKLGTTLDMIKVRSRKKEILRNRQILMHLLYWYGYGCSEISRYIIPFDHATVLHSYRTINNDLLTDRHLKVLINEMKEWLKEPFKK